MKSIKNIISALLILLLLSCDPLGILCEDVYAKSNIVIVIDPGHGGPGTTDEQELGAKYNGVFEKDLTLITATAMKNELEQYGNVTVYMTRSTDQAMTLANRSAFAASVGADALISIHYNASAEHNFYGAEVFSSAFGEHYATGKGLGSCFLKQLCVSGSADKGCKTRIGKSGTDYYGIIRHGVNNHVPTIIVEHGYIDNNTDWNRMNNAAAWQQLGIGDAAAVADYYGLKKGLTQVDVAPTVAVAVPTSTMSPDLTPPANVSVTIDQINANEHKVTFTAKASEPESKMMYCTYSTDDGLTYAPLSLWGNGTSHMETIDVPAGFSGQLLVRVYNNYELDTVSNPIDLKLESVSETNNTDHVSSTEPDKNKSDIMNSSSTDKTSAAGDTDTDKTSSANSTDAANSSPAEVTEDTSLENSGEPLWGDTLQVTLEEQSAAPETDSASTFPAWGVAAITVGAILLGAVITAVCIAYLREKRRRKRRKKR